MADKVKELKAALDADVKAFFENNKDVEVAYATIDGNIFRKKFVRDAKEYAQQNGLELYEYSRTQELRAKNQEVKSEGGEAAPAGEKQPDADHTAEPDKGGNKDVVPVVDAPAKPAAKPVAKKAETKPATKKAAVEKAVTKTKGGKNGEAKK